MKIAIITGSPNEIILSIINNWDVACIFQSPPRRRKSLVRKSIKIVVEYSSEILGLKRKSLRYIAKKNHCEFYHYEVDFIKKYLIDNHIDLLFVYGMSSLLPKSVWNIPKCGTINVHLSYLPDYRGPFPEFWYYLNYDLNPGVSVHYIDETEDTGDIICQEKFTLKSGSTSREYFDIAERKLGVKLANRAIGLIQNNDFQPLKQKNLKPTPRARNLSISEHKNFIQWNSWGVDRTFHFLKGVESWMNPIDPPFFHFLGFRWTYYIKSRNQKYFKSKTGLVNRKIFGGSILVCDGEIGYKLDLNLKNIIRNFINYGNK